MAQVSMRPQVSPPAPMDTSPSWAIRLANFSEGGREEWRILWKMLWLAELGEEASEAMADSADLIMSWHINCGSLEVYVVTREDHLQHSS